MENVNPKKPPFAYAQLDQMSQPFHTIKAEQYILFSCFRGWRDIYTPRPLPNGPRPNLQAQRFLLLRGRDWQRPEPGEIRQTSGILARTPFTHALHRGQAAQNRVGVKHGETIASPALTKALSRTQCQGMEGAQRQLAFRLQSIFRNLWHGARKQQVKNQNHPPNKPKTKATWTPSCLEAP